MQPSTEDIFLALQAQLSLDPLAGQPNKGKLSWEQEQEHNGRPFYRQKVVKKCFYALTKTLRTSVLISGTLSLLSGTGRTQTFPDHRVEVPQQRQEVEEQRQDTCTGVLKPLTLPVDLSGSRRRGQKVHRSKTGKVQALGGQMEQWEAGLPKSKL